MLSRLSWRVVAGLGAHANNFECWFTLVCSWPCNLLLGFNVQLVVRLTLLRQQVCI